MISYDLLSLSSRLFPFSFLRLLLRNKFIQKWSRFVCEWLSFLRLLLRCAVEVWHLNSKRRKQVRWCVCECVCVWEERKTLRERKKSVRIYLYVQMCVYAYAEIYTWINLQLKETYVCIHTYVSFSCRFIHVYISAYAYTHICTYRYIRTLFFLSRNVFLSSQTHTHSHTHHLTCFLRLLLRCHTSTAHLNSKRRKLNHSQTNRDHFCMNLFLNSKRRKLKGNRREESERRS